MSRDEDRLSVPIVRGIAEAEGVATEELEFRLQDWIDVDALETLDDHDGGEWSLQFAVADHEVTVTSDGTVDVDGSQVR